MSMSMSVSNDSAISSVKDTNVSLVFALRDSSSETTKKVFILSDVFSFISACNRLVADSSYDPDSDDYSDDYKNMLFEFYNTNISKVFIDAIPYSRYLVANDPTSSSINNYSLYLIGYYSNSDFALESLIDPSRRLPKASYAFSSDSFDVV